MMVLEHLWLSPPADLTLPSSVVHVWRTTLDQPAKSVRQLAQTLSDDERIRAGCFRFKQDSERFIVGRGVLRTILGCYLGIEPSRLQFCYGPQGKPYLAEGYGDGTLRFNVAHSHGLALYAFNRGRKVGIDLERVCAEVPCEELAARFFSPREITTLRSQPPAARQRAFFACWTRKEAYVKARGEGLSFPLDQFDVSLTSSSPARSLGVKGDPMEASRWSLQSLAPGPGYVAALAVEGQGWRLKCWRWDMYWME